MILSNFKDTNGNWHDSCIVEQFDIDTSCPGPYKQYKDKVLSLIDLGKPVNPHFIRYCRPDSDNDKVNVCLGLLSQRFDTLRNKFFEGNRNGNKINAIGPNGFYFNTGKVEEHKVEEPEHTKEKERLYNWEALLSTRRIVAMTGATLYDGPEFKFRSNLHPSPSAGAIDALAKDYTMNVIIPNALLALHLLGRKSEAIWDGECFVKAIRYCMTTGKAQKSIDAWEEYLRKTNGDSIINLWKKYVLNKDENGNPIPADRRWYFKKFIDMRCKGNTSKFRKSKNQDELQKLLERMKSEPELRTATHRKLLDMGITNRLARQFEKARKR